MEWKEYDVDGNNIYEINNGTGKIKNIIYLVQLNLKENI